MKKSAPPRTKGSPDQVEGQPVSEEGLAGDSSQSLIDLETLLIDWGPHANIAAHREHTVKYITSNCLQARSMQKPLLLGSSPADTLRLILKHLYSCCGSVGARSSIHCVQWPGKGAEASPTPPVPSAPVLCLHIGIQPAGRTFSEFPAFPAPAFR